MLLAPAAGLRLPTGRPCQVAPSFQSSAADPVPAAALGLFGAALTSAEPSGRGTAQSLISDRPLRAWVLFGSNGELG